MPQSQSSIDAWKALTPEQKQDALGRMSPEQKHQLATAFGYTPPVEPSESTASAQPGFLDRYKQSAGVPTSWEQVKSSIHAVMHPIDTAKQYGQNVKQQYGMAKQEVGEAAQNVQQGGSVTANTGKAFAAATEFLLRGIASPLGGDVVQNFGEDIGKGNYAGAAGDAAGLFTQALIAKAGSKAAASKLLEKVPLPAGDDMMRGAARNILMRARATLAEAPNEKMVNKLSYASKVAGKDADAIGVVANDLRQTASKVGRPQNMDGYLDIIQKTNEGFETETGAALHGIKGNPVAPNPIADSIHNLITPEMRKFPERYRAEIRAINQESARFQRPMTIEVLDDARRNARNRLTGYYKKAITPKTSVSEKIDLAIGNGAAEIVNPYLDAEAGKPAGYFENLRRRQASLIDLRENVEKEIGNLKAISQRSKGTPMLDRGSASFYLSSSLKPGGSLHRLHSIFKAEDPYWKASKAVKKGFETPRMSRLRQIANATAPARNFEIQQHPDDEQ